MFYKEGSKDYATVREIQQALNIKVDGQFGPKTTQAVIRFQSDNHIVADGVVGPETLEVMGILDTDQRTQLIFRTDNGLTVERRYLPQGEYIVPTAPQNNDYLFIHHTGGWHNPFNVIDEWGRDTRGKIATEFVIGGQNFKTADDEYDGRVVQAFPEGMQGWHLGNTGSYYMNKHSVGIEMCNFGQLNSEGKNYINVKGHESQIVTLNEAFRGYTNWHKYSERQLYALKKLIYHISSRDDIDIREGVVKWLHNGGAKKAFSFNQEAYEGKIKGLLLHNNVRKDKVDVFPQTELIDMLLSL